MAERLLNRDKGPVMEYVISDITKQLHDCQLLLAAELKRICEKHQIKYFMIAGTLLGAVRHQGFIPWDDDMDFAMMRPDFDRFMEIAKTELGEEFVLQDMHTDPNYGMPVTKLMLRHTRLVEQSAAKNKAWKHIFIDIFPYDNIPDLPAQQKTHDRKTYLLKRLLLVKQHYTVVEKGEILKKIIYGLLRIISFFFTKNYLRKSLDHELRRYSGVQTSKVAAIGGAYQYKKESVERAWFAETVELPFEHLTLLAPKDYEKYLTYFYGNYMTPPPVAQREDRHNVVELNFGPYHKSR